MGTYDLRLGFQSGVAKDEKFALLLFPTRIVRVRAPLVGADVEAGDIDHGAAVRAEVGSWPLLLPRSFPVPIVWEAEPKNFRSK